MSESSDASGSIPLKPKQQSLLRSSALMASGTLVSRVLGLVRSAMLVAAIGLTAGAAASFQVANTLPTTVYNLLAAGALDAILVPQIVRALRSKSGSPYVNKLITAVGTLLFGLTILAMIATPVLVTIFAPTLEPETRKLTITFALLCVPQVFFYGVYNLFGQILNARGVFGPYMWAPVVNNIVSIASLAVFLAIWGPAGEVVSAADLSTTQTLVLCGSATLGVVLQALVLIVPIKNSGVKLRLDFRFKGTSFGSAPKVAVWTFATLMVSQFGVISTSNLATRADSFTDSTGTVVAGIQAYQYAFMMFMLPQSLIAVTLVTAIFTRLANNAAERDLTSLGNNYLRGFQLIVVLSMLASGILAVTATPLMQVLMPTFGTQAASLYGAVLVALAIGVPSTGAALLGQRVFYALEDAKPVFLMGIIPAILQLCVGWGIYFLTSAEWWTIGAATGETVARLSLGFISFFMVSRAIPQIRAGQLFLLYGKYFVAFVISALVGWGALHLVGPGADAASGSLLRMIGAGWRILLVSAVITAVYLMVLRVMDPTAYLAVVGQIRKRLIRNASSPSSATGDRDGLREESEVLASEASAEPGLISGEALLPAELDAKTDGPNGVSPTKSGNRLPMTTDHSWSPEAPSWEDLFAGESGVVAIGRSMSAPDPSATGAMPVLTGSMMSLAGSQSKEKLPLSQWLEETLESTEDSDAAWPQGLTDLRDKPESRPARDSYASATDVITHRTPEDDKPGTLNGAENTAQIRANRVMTPPPRPVRRRTVGNMSSNPSAYPRGTAPSAPRQTARQSTRKKRGRFDPTIPALFVGFLVIVGAVWFAYNNLFPSGDGSLVAQSEQSVQSGQSEQSGQSGTEPEGSTDTPVVSVVPVVSSATVLSWSDDGGDHPELSATILDGDPNTYWRSRYFDPATYAQGPAAVVVLNLQEPATVNQVSIAVRGSGGEVAIVDATEGDPRSGTVLATSALSGETIIRLADPTEVSSLGLVFTSLPVDDEGRNRIKVVSVSVE